MQNQTNRACITALHRLRQFMHIHSTQYKSR
jgi:hypothetical protein